MEFGEYTIEAIAQDNDGNSSSDVITINVIDYPVDPGSNILVIDGDTNLLLEGTLNYAFSAYQDSIYYSDLELIKDQEDSSYYFFVGVLLHDEIGFTGEYIIDASLSVPEDYNYGIAFEVGYNQVNVDNAFGVISSGELQIFQQGSEYTIIFEGVDTNGSSVYVYYNDELEIQ